MQQPNCSSWSSATSRTSEHETERRRKNDAEATNASPKDVSSKEHSPRTGTGPDPIRHRRSRLNQPLPLTTNPHLHKQLDRLSQPRGSREPVGFPSSFPVSDRHGRRTSLLESKCTSKSSLTTSRSASTRVVSPITGVIPTGVADEHRIVSGTPRRYRFTGGHQSWKRWGLLAASTRHPSKTR